MNGPNVVPSSNPDESARPVEVISETMDHFISAAHVTSVYGQPIHSGDRLIIPAAEVIGGLGFGIGSGSGVDNDQGGKDVSKGSGGGGGGFVQSRPVAVIVATPEGVRVEPVFDITKIALAGLTAFGFMLSTLSQMRRQRR